MDQNESFKDVLLSLANSLQEIVHALTGDADQEYVRLTPYLVLSKHIAHLSLNSLPL
jgi:hypothetical protein